MKNIKWDTAVSVLALVVSFASLFYTYQVEKSKSSPNIQVQSVYGGRTIESDDPLSNVTTKTIDSTIILINVGNAPTQIVDVQWEFVTSLDTNFDGSLAISDTRSPSDLQYKEYFESIKSSPIQGIKETTLSPGQTLTLQMVFRSTPVPQDDTTLQNIRVIFTFGNGQQLIVLPELRYFGSSTKF